MLDRLQDLRKNFSGYWDLVRDPIGKGRREANSRIFTGLPENLQTPFQALGVQQSGCAATYNIMERCNFSCTACYLTKEANQTPALPFDEVCRQIDDIREYLGPGGNIQITAGEVTLMPVEDLVRIIKYAASKELSPMVMSHGDTFRTDGEYLRRLMVEGGLEKVAIHVDTTQRGRKKLNIAKREKDLKEVDLHVLRDEFADMIRDIRQSTGRPLSAAHTFTIDDNNFDEVPDVMRWVVDNSDAFRLISFQPTADVGRTRTGAVTGRRDRIWEKICEGVGLDLNRHPFHFGHPDCNFMGLFFVVKFAGETHLVEVHRQNNTVDRLFIQRLLQGPLAGFNTDGLKAGGQQLAYLLGHIAQDPTHIPELAAFGAFRAFGERKWIPRLIKAMATGKEWSINPCAIIVHNFMSREELDTPLGRARLEACAFRLPVEGEMIPMCQMNGTDLRQDLNIKARKRLSPKRRTAA